ncbi:MerR family transcriptional regulator [Pseudoclavibacter sp. CFCC 11306]|uniref:MerR family transcriptional regulator n=1 Tax=Pseudoclavibacter sp. CFCC 11306 TaxID=1564493 RepID=UPI0013017097|nr:MerR family transcriptional regulator [Pseudoclavibacter sp. CFCC 11306]KAB1658547.1 MerR family transcriptional regulator [Pseudoclavibacter sp. CFCC 11306]
MATDDLIRTLMQQIDATPDAGAVDLLHELLDDATIEDSSNEIGIAEAAQLVGLSAHTLRYYEQQKLVRPTRDAQGRRRYDAFALRRLVFVTRMRVSGMGMSELRRYIALVEQGDATIPERRQIMLDQRDRIERQIAELELAREATDFKIARYSAPE